MTGIVLLWAALPVCAPVPLTLPQELRLGVEEIYSGALEQARLRFERLEGQEPTRPEGPLFTAFTLWFSIDEDPFNADLRQKYREKVRQAQKLAQPFCDRPVRSDERAQGCLALGLAHGGLARLNALEGITLRAASEARAGKRALERALEIRPDDANVLFGLGLYNYYAARLPRALRLLRFLLLLPGGDRERGLAQLEKARAEADLLGAEALLQLHDIYKFYEKDYPKALQAIEELDRRFPENPRYDFLQIQLEGHFMGRAEDAEAHCRRVLEAVARGKEGFEETEALWARYFGATVRFRMGERERALEELEALIEEPDRSRSPVWRPVLTLTAALAAELSGRPSETLFRAAAREIGRRQNLRFIETHIRSVLPPQGEKAYKDFEKRFGQYLQGRAA